MHLYTLFNVLIQPIQLSNFTQCSPRKMTHESGHHRLTQHGNDRLFRVLQNDAQQRKSCAITETRQLT
jgi:hypothetical protein